jgi:hypothetical protein
MATLLNPRVFLEGARGAQTGVLAVVVVCAPAQCNEFGE